MNRIILILLTFCTAAWAADPGGLWTGAIELPNGKLAISIELEKNDSWAGTISIPAQAIRDKALANVKIEGDKVSFTLPGIPGDPKFDGVLANEGKSLAGTFSQGGNTLKFALDRAEKIAGPPIEKRIERLVKRLEEKRVEYHIPGMAIAVVKDGKVILSHGFGLADVEKKSPVTPDTIFAIGSTTKAFTAIATGMLVDEGMMKWDDPVTRHLPDFKLQIDSDEDGAEVTIRDLLAHRTGFARMGILWAGGKISRAEVLATATKAKPYAKFRDKFQYNNVTYLAAGQASAAAAGTEWDTLIAERIFKPLGMTNSGTSYEKAQADSRLSTGYLPKEEPTAVPMRHLDAIGPAGSINSNVTDMAKWVQFQLAGGVVGGKRLVSEEQLEETRKPQMDIGGGVKYGLGWMLRPIDGRRVVEHGGNIDGFGAQVGLFPDDNLGFVLLTNVSATPLQSLSNNMVGQTILGEWTEEAPPVDAKEFEPYLGTYIGNFATFKNSEFKVLVKNGKLAVDVPGQMVYELKAPGEDGKWVFAITETIAISFDRDVKDKVIGMKMYQGGAIFEIPRKGVERKAEIEEAEAKQFLGKYKYDDKLAFEVLFNNGRLAVNIPGKIQSDLHPPNKDGKRKLRVLTDSSLKFNLSEKGEVESMTLFRDGRDPKKMPRLEGGGDKVATGIPSIEEVLALRNVEGRGAAFAKLKSLRITNKLIFIHAGLEGKSTILLSGADRIRLSMDLGRFGYDHRIINAAGGRTESSFKPSEELTGKYLEQSRQQSFAVLFGDWRKHFDDISVLPSEKIKGRKTLVVQLKSRDLPPITAWVDAGNGDLLKTQINMLVPAMNIEIPSTVLYENHRDAEGMRLPWKNTATNDMSGSVVTEIEKVEINLELDEALFKVKSR